MISLPRFEQWLEIARTEPLAESPEIAAGRQAEEFLKGLVDSNLRFKGAHCFVGKRVPAPALRRRFEIDLVVLTRKQLHILEVKNWSGELFPQRKGWVQRKRDGREIGHQNLTCYNSQKVDVLLGRNSGIPGTPYLISPRISGAVSVPKFLHSFEVLAKPYSRS